MENEHTHEQTPRRGLQFPLDRLESMGFPNHLGYSFDGWVTKQENADETPGTDEQTSNEVTTYEDGAQVTFLNDTDLYATWKPISWDITYNMNYPQDYTGVQQTEPSEALHEYTIQDQYQPNSPLNITGYDFSGWTPAMIQKGTTGAITFTASWIPSTGNEWNIEYDKQNDEASVPSDFLKKYSADTLQDRDGYSPDDLENSKKTMVSSSRYSDQGSWVKSEVRTHKFKGWSPLTLHKYRTGDMHFTATWQRTYTSTFEGYPLSDNAVLGNLKAVTYTLSFGSNKIWLYHKGETSTHSGNIYLKILARQNINSSNKPWLAIANVPIPKSCVKINGNVVSGSNWDEAEITTTTVNSNNTGTQTLALAQKTVKYQFTINAHQSPSFTITNVPVTIPACGTKIPSGVLKQDGEYYYPTHPNFVSTQSIEYLIMPYIEENNSGCKGMSMNWDNTATDNNNKITLSLMVPYKSIVTYQDGSETLVDATSIGENAFDINQPIKRVVVGNMVTEIETEADFGAASEIILTKKVQTLKANALSACQAENLVIPANVTSIENGCFARCPNLRLLAIESPLSAYQGSSELFTDCPNLNTLYLDHCTTSQYLAYADQWWGGSGMVGGTPPANLRVICRDGEIYNGQIVT